MHRSTKLFADLALVTLIPSVGYTQDGSITGSVRDSAGGVLPGVTVEARSPALIEKVRVVTTDGNGQYRIVSLRPWHLRRHLHPPWLRRRQAGRHRADRVVYRHRQCRPVASARSKKRSRSPVNPRSSTSRASEQQRVLSSEVVAAIPSARTVQTLAVLVPGVDVGAPVRTMSAGRRLLGAAAIRRPWQQHQRLPRAGRWLPHGERVSVVHRLSTRIWAAPRK